MRFPNIKLTLLIAYSIDGLFVRSYLSGLNLSSNTVAAVISPAIRKLVLIGTPNFAASGGSVASAAVQALGGIQGPEMLPGGQTIWDLNTWNQQGDDMRGVDTVVIADSGNPLFVSDGVVSVNRASVSFAFSDGDQRTRALSALNATPIYLSLVLQRCARAPAALLLTFPMEPIQATRSFAVSWMEPTRWKTIGVSGSQASTKGGLLWGGVF